MKRRIVYTMVLGLVVLGSGVALAAGGYDLSWWTASGGGASRGNSYSLSGAIGQPAAGDLSSTGYRLSGGFWVGSAAAAPLQPMVYLPLARR